MTFKQEGNTLEDELIVYVGSDTRTVDLLDQFEGYGDYEGSPTYRRIVISNLKYAELIGGKLIGYNLVIERSNSHDYVGDITFTGFKQNRDYGLRKHVKEEIPPEIVEAYLDKYKFYRFKKPYLLRAQNSSNRVGYGWQWDWTGGYGNYIEGTEYGETTNYVFVGAYITSGYVYIPGNRIHFSNCNEKSLDNKEYQIITYVGDIRDIDNDDIQEWFVLTERGGSVKTYTPVYVDPKSHYIYVQDTDYNTYNTVFIQNTLVLHPKNGTKDKEIRILPKPEDGIVEAFRL